MRKGEAKGHMDIAHRMKAKSYSVDDIADITGLSSNEIESL